MAQGRRKADAAAVRKPTRRMVLEKVAVMPLVGDSRGQEVEYAWVERGEQEGDHPKAAIEKYVKPGTPEQREGEFRAVPLSNWKGGRRYKLPEQVPLIGESID